MKFYLTVGIHGEQKGIVSLWDQPMHSMDTHEAGKNREHYVELPLTKEQIRMLTFNGVRPVNVKEEE